jgi:3-methyladenine DNA glycosylase AlkD
MTEQVQPIDTRATAAQIDAEIRATPGRRAPFWHALRRKYTKQLAKAPAAQVVALAHTLLERYGRRWLAYDLINHHRAALASIDAAELESFGQGMDSWGAVDSFGRALSGPVWRQRQAPDALIHKWARSEDRWWRRGALVSTVPLNVRARGGTGDVPRTLAVCRLLVDDRDDMVVKALSWALRELVVYDPDAVWAFLAEYDDRLAARVKREVRNKLTTGLKNPRKSKKGTR